jgi:hypothetical protein
MGGWEHTIPHQEIVMMLGSLVNPPQVTRTAGSGTNIVVGAIDFFAIYSSFDLSPK